MSKPQQKRERHGTSCASTATSIKLVTCSILFYCLGHPGCSPHLLLPAAGAAWRLWKLGFHRARNHGGASDEIRRPSRCQPYVLTISRDMYLYHLVLVFWCIYYIFLLNLLPNHFTQGYPRHTAQIQSNTWQMTDYNMWQSWSLLGADTTAATWKITCYNSTRNDETGLGKARDSTKAIVYWRCLRQIVTFGGMKRCCHPVSKIWQLLHDKFVNCCIGLGLVGGTRG